jgi:hypothetical protein
VKYFRVILPVLLVILFASVIYFTPRIIKVGEIVCKSQFGPCSIDIATKLDFYEGRSLSEVKGSISEYLRAETAVDEYSFQFKLPGRLEVNIIEQKAKYALGKNDLSVFSLIDRDGTVIKVQNETNLPTLLIEDNPPNLGEKVDREKLFGLAIVSRMFTLYQVKEGRIENSSLVVMLPDGITVAFPLEGNEDELMGALSLILSRLKSPSKDSKIDYSTVKKIDLRFKNPVLQ